MYHLYTRFPPRFIDASMNPPVKAATAQSQQFHANETSRTICRDGSHLKFYSIEISCSCAYQNTVSVGQSTGIWHRPIKYVGDA